MLLDKYCQISRVQDHRLYLFAAPHHLLTIIGHYLPPTAAAAELYIKIFDQGLLERESISSRYRGGGGGGGGDLTEYKTEPLH